MLQEARRALDAVLYGLQGNLLEGTFDGSVHVEGALVGNVVELVLAVVQLGLGEDSLDGIPIWRIALVVDEANVQLLAQMTFGSMVLGEIVGEEGDGDSSILVAEECSEFDELLVLAGVVEGVEVGDADVVVDGGGGLSEAKEGVFLVDDGVAVHPRPVATLVDVLGEEDLIDVEEHTSPLSRLVQLLEDALRRRGPLLLAGIDGRLHHPDHLLLDAELAVEAAKLGGRDLGVDESTMEEYRSIL